MNEYSLTKKEKSLGLGLDRPRDGLDDVFNFSGLEGLFGLSTTLQPKSRVLQKEDRSVYTLAAPGLKKEDFAIKVDTSRLTVSYTVRADKKDLYSQSSYSDSLTLTSLADVERITAKYEDGLLTIDIPVRTDVPVEPRTITVR